MKLRLIITTAVLVLAVTGFWFYQHRNLALQAATTVSSVPTVLIDGQHFDVELALTPVQQTQGLSGRQSLASHHGMLFVINPPEAVSFWMREMKFPLDMVFIDTNSKINYLVRNAPVPAQNQAPATLITYTPPGLVKYVLELNAGETTNFKVGDPVDITYNQTL